MAAHSLTIALRTRTRRGRQRHSRPWQAFGAGPSFTAHARPMRLENADWERRRSLSPVKAVAPAAGGATNEGVDERHIMPIWDDWGSALLSGSLQLADGAPSPPMLHPDPMMDFYKGLCEDDITTANCGSYMGWDPMLGEASAMCREVAARPLSFSPPPFPSLEIPTSPVYTPVSALWSKVADLNEEATALGLGNVVHFRPRHQLTQEVGGQVVETTITEQVAELILEERRDSIVQSMFVPCDQPLLEAPIPAKVSKRAKASKTAKKVGTRRSARQMANAKISSVPVSQRATQRLVKAFGYTGDGEQTGEQALEEYINSFSTPMTEARIKAVRLLTSLDSEAVLTAAAQVATDQEMTVLEEMAV